VAEIPQVEFISTNTRSGIDRQAMILSALRRQPSERVRVATTKIGAVGGIREEQGDLICASQRSCCVVVLFAMGASVIPARAIDCFWTGATTNEWTITAS
jgi:hypothetical protein